jgi:hypothetical protein
MLFWNQVPVTIYTEWQSEIEANLEAGRTPLLDLGGSNLILDDLCMLAALRTFVARRVDVTAPVMIAGGNSAFWLAVLMQMQPISALRRPLAPTIVFAGADRASYLATLTMFVPDRSSESGHMPQSAPANMAPLFTPYTQTRASLPWDLLPFAVTEEALAFTRSPGSQRTASIDTWVGWAAIGLTLLLILLALIP